MNKALRGKIKEVFRTQDEFAKAVSVNGARVSLVIACKKELPPQEQHRWALKLRCRRDEIFSGGTKNE